MLAPATLAALPSTRAIPHRDVFYVAHPISSIPIADFEQTYLNTAAAVAAATRTGKLISIVVNVSTVA